MCTPQSRTQRHQTAAYSTVIGNHDNFMFITKLSTTLQQNSQQWTENDFHLKVLISIMPQNYKSYYSKVEIAEE